MKIGIAIMAAVICGVCGASSAAQGVGDGQSGRPSDTPRAKHVRIRVLPEGAVLFINGQPMGNPLDLELPMGGEVPRVEARLLGYESLSVVMDAAHDARRYEIHLARRAAPSGARRAPDPSDPASFLRGLQTPGGMSDHRQGGMR